MSCHQMIPEDLSVSLCGSAYFVVYVDHREKVGEWSELDNIVAVPITIACHDRQCFLASLFQVLVAFDRRFRSGMTSFRNSNKETREQPKYA